jgi:hypothetical protein
MTIFLLLVLALVLADAVSLARGLRADRPAKAPRSWDDWGTPTLPTGPFAAR